MDNPIVHEDVLGRPLAVGDYVVFPNISNGSTLYIGKITSIAPKTVRVERILQTKRESIYPSAICKITNEEDITFHLLRKQKNA